MYINQTIASYFLDIHFVRSQYAVLGITQIDLEV